MARKNKSLLFKVRVHSAADLVETPGANGLTVSETRKGQDRKCNPIVTVVFNETKKRTSRRFNTNNPTWNQTLTFKLRPHDYSQVLTLVIWDRGQISKVYLGELRLCVHDVFHKDGIFCSKTTPKWYKLYSSRSNQSFVTGSVLLSFELLAAKRKRNKKGKSGFADENAIPDDLAWINRSLYGEEANTGDKKIEKVQKDELSSGSAGAKLDGYDFDEDVSSINSIDSAREASLDAWSKSIIRSNDDDERMAAPDEQGFYCGASVSSDASSLDMVVNAREEEGEEEEEEEDEEEEEEEEDEEDEDDEEGEEEEVVVEKEASKGNERNRGRRWEDPIDIEDLEIARTSSQFLNLDVGDISSLSGSSAIASETCDDFDEDEQKGYISHGPPLRQAKSNKKKFLKFKKNKKMKVKKVKKDQKFSLMRRDTLGIIFVEIVSCSGLPPYKNFSRTTFDMDPFVVITFGKKTFRTSWKRHTLNPIFNERIALEISKHEKNFDIQFFVLDKDKFSFNDKIASVSLKIGELTDMTGQPASVSSEDYLYNDGNTSSSPLSSGEAEYSNMSSKITLLEQDNIIPSVRRKRFTKRKKVTSYEADTSKFRTMNLKLDLHKEKYSNKYHPELKIRVRFEPYESLRRNLWHILLEQYNFNEIPGKYDYIELLSFLETLGCEFSERIVSQIFEKYNLQPWSGDLLSNEQIIDALEDYIENETEPEQKLIELEKCPLCCEKRLSKSQDIDIITHVAVCASKDWSIVSKLLVSSYVTPQVASRRWFSKILIKLTYGSYKLGGNSANILVQDRNTGVVMEEVMSVYVRLGIRLLYKGFDTTRSSRIRRLLRTLSMRQGIKFDSPQSKNDIRSFVKFHKLDLSECVESDISKYNTFNEFFYRKLKPGSRPVESSDSCIVVSPADCRCTAFVNVDDATTLWIKGRNFTLAKLFNGNFNNLEGTDLYDPKKCAIGLFRLAPQDYHRFHSPVNGTISCSKFIEGEYYTVNPMAIRSELDVFGENVRLILQIDTEEFGPVILIAVGAMMVGSIVLTVKVGETVKRGDEIGYFKFGGSTIILLFQKKCFTFDSDLVQNSEAKIETLIRVGQSIGHKYNVVPYARDHIDFSKQSSAFKLNLIHVITGGEISPGKSLNEWQESHITRVPSKVEK